jgi:L-methionine (R)-S-oxide reductase
VDVAETMLDLRYEPKERAYAILHAHLLSVLSGMDDDIAAMATMSALIHHAFRHLWTGFYRVVAPTLLRVGPYQGTLGCMEIQFGKGVCGTVAAERRSIVVPDVDRFPGHISCDARSKSEIVLPVTSRTGELIAVLDIDSEQRARFDQLDAAGLERILSWFAGVGRG